MPCKIKKDWTLEQGKENYYMLTGDFGSLQMRLTCIDTKLDGQIDPSLYELYGPAKPGEKKISDAHSMTGMNTFCKSIGFQMYDIEMDDGTTKSLPQNQNIKVNRGGKEVTIQVMDLQPNDDIVSLDE